MTDGGYGCFVFMGKKFGAHRASWMIHHPDEQIPAGINVCHTCDNKVCVNPSHLFLGTPKENSLDAARKGLYPQRKLLPEQVREIRALYAGGGLRYKDIAPMFGVGNATIADVIKGRCHTHVL